MTSWSLDLARAKRSTRSILCALICPVTARRHPRHRGCVLAGQPRWRNSLLTSDAPDMSVTLCVPRHEFQEKKTEGGHAHRLSWSKSSARRRGLCSWCGHEGSFAGVCLWLCDQKVLWGLSWWHDLWPVSWSSGFAWHPPALMTRESPSVDQHVQAKMLCWKSIFSDRANLASVTTLTQIDLNTRQTSHIYGGILLNRERAVVVNKGFTIVFNRRWGSLLSF